MPEGRILIVDDEPAIRLALREVLRPRWEVTEAPDGEEALACLDADGAFDLVLTDVRMPRLTGLELLHRLGGRPKGPPVIVMTAFATVEDAVAAMRAGAVDYLMKPFSAEAVLEAAERALRRAAADRAAESGDGAKTRSKARRENPHPLIAEDPAMRQVLDFVEAIADSEATVLITGQSGVGKEIVARHIHRRSRRAAGPFVAVNCAALPDSLLESELFGFEKGAFTGAVQTRPGKFELANGGTLLLDEISEMPPALQAKLLRVLQEHTVDPIGARAPVAVDIRVLATTNRDLTQAIADSQFRQDLFYRLNVIGVDIPPLSRRPRDIEPLARFFIRKHAVRNRRPVPRVSQEVIDHLHDQPWVGNVRELENFLERAVLLTRGEEMALADLHLPTHTPVLGSSPAREPSPTTLAEMERHMILATLHETGGNRTRAAEILGVSVRTIRNKINEYGLKEAV
jgi:DNA-binding NtrC family response regulator